MARRITPAYAGKRERARPVNLRKKDHPCVCGEKIFKVRIGLIATGSPLRMRGKVKILLLCCNGYRITPAYAGKRRYYDLKGLFIEDHPCVCGEKLYLLVATSQ